MNVFDKKFKNRLDIGREYYEGNYEEMEKEFLEIINLKNIICKTNTNPISKKNINCICGKSFNCRKICWRHKKSCKKLPYIEKLNENTKTMIKYTETIKKSN